MAAATGTIGTDLVRLAVDPHLGIVRERQQVQFALMGADLAELAVAGRVEVRGGWLTERIVVTGPQPTGDALLDTALAALTAAKRPDPADWARQKLRTRALEDYLDLLASRSEVLLHSRQAGGRFARQVLTEATLLEPGRAARDRATARLAAYVARPPPTATPAGLLEWAFAGLVFETGLASLVYPGRANRDAFRRLRDAARAKPGPGDGPAAAVIRAAIQATRNGSGASYG